MAGGSDSSNGKNKKNPSKPRRWVLQSPGRKPTTGVLANTPPDRAPLSAPRAPSGSPREQAQQAHLQQQTTAPVNGSSSTETSGSSRFDASLNTADDTGEASAGTIRTRSRSPLSRIRNKMPAPSANLMKRFRRKNRNVVGGSSIANKVQEQRLSIGGTKACSSTETDAELIRHSNDGGKLTEEDASASPTEEYDETRCLEVLLREPCTAVAEHDSSTRQFHTAYDAGYRGDNKLLDEGKGSETAIEREAIRAHKNLGMGKDAISAVQAGKQPPRIAFIGVFLNGAAVAMASYAPFGGVDARIELVKSLLLEPIAVVRPGGCYTARGAALAVHVVVDQKHRVYACITAEDVPLSLGLSLLEEVQIEYISTVATLAFSTKENSHNTRCHAQMARSWAKYEGVERNLAHERETRRLLGEDPLDIESPGGSNRTHTGAEVTPLQFTAEHQAVLLAASHEIFSLEEQEGGGVAGAAGVAVEATRSDGSAAATRLEKLGHEKIKAALLVTGVTGLFAGLYAARHTIFSL